MFTTFTLILIAPLFPVAVFALPAIKAFFARVPYPAWTARDIAIANSNGLEFYKNAERKLS